MKPISFILLFLVIVLSENACKKAETTDTPQQQKRPISIDSMLRCHNFVNADSSSIRNALITKWQWKFISCYWKPENANSEDFKTLTIEFKQNDSLEVRINNVTTQKSSWYLKRLADGFYKLISSSFIPQLSGKVLVCGDQLLFYDTYVDGCDNYFKKLK